MKMVKCIKGHMYNAEKFSACPYCSGMDSEAELAGAEERQEDIDTEDPDTLKQQKYEIIGRRKVVGCLICVQGVMYGEGFFLVEGYNDIGRAANLEVALTKEVTVSRKAQACIIYDEEKNQYMLKAAKGVKNVFYNGALVEDTVRMSNDDVIAIGRCRLRFIAFCDDGFQWDRQVTMN